MFRPHQWFYYNPYDRTCSICSRREVSHYFPDHQSNNHWEVFNDGDEQKHKS